MHVRAYSSLHHEYANEADDDDHDDDDNDDVPKPAQSLGTPVPRQKCMQVGIDVMCMHINFGGRGLYSFGNTATLKNGQFSLSDHYNYSMVIKKFNQSESAQKIHAYRG